MFFIFFINQPRAEEEISGIWQGRLQVSPENTVKIQFIIEQESNSSYAAELNSPDDSRFKNVPATIVSYNKNIISMQFDVLDGTYTGILGDGKITGSWTQPGSEIPLDLTPYIRTGLSRADKEKLTGNWYGVLKHPSGMELGNQRMKFETDSNGDFSGAMRGDRSSSWMPFHKLELVGEELELRFETGGTYYRGIIGDSELAGALINSSGVRFELIMTRGEYSPPEMNENLTAAVKKQLIGEWRGELELPGGVIPVLYRFENTESGTFNAVRFNNPDFKASPPIQLKEITLKDGELIIKPVSQYGEFRGELSGDVMTGENISPMGPLPLILKKLK